MAFSRCPGSAVTTAAPDKLQTLQYSQLLLEFSFIWLNHLKRIEYRKSITAPTLYF
jgi:hypothetical protein